MQTVHLLIKGKVQGVYYRASAKEVAKAITVTGWIKNTADGDVEALVTGSEEAVLEFVNWCRTGPQKAEVTDVIATEKDITQFEAFSILR